MKEKIPRMRAFSVEDEVFDEADYTEEDYENIRRARAKDGDQKDKIPWSTRHPRLSRFTDGCLSIFFLLAFIGGGICVIAAATTILVEGTKALFRIIGNLF